jgi:multimeric flavodoxin WrbA
MGQQDPNRRLLLGAAAAAAMTAAVAPVARGQAATADAGSGSGNPVKIIGISGSLRKGKTTGQALQLALDAAKTVSPLITTELVELSGLNLDAYIAVKGKMVEKDDDFPALRDKLVAPDVHGIILGSPVYMGIVSSPLKQFIERCLAFRQGGFPLRNKVGGAVAVGAGRNTGVELVLQQMVMFMLSQDLVVVGDGKPTAHWGGTVWNQGDDITKDETGLATVRGVGKRVAETAVRMARSA